jgi:hypothetical protein
MTAPLKNALILSQIVKNMASINKIKPDLIVCGIIPSTINTWIYMHVAQAMGIKIQYMSFTLLPWRFARVEGVCKIPVVIPPEQEEIFTGENKLLSQYGRLKNSGYETALPIYMKKHLKQNRKKIFDFFNDLCRYWRRPDILLNKALCYYTNQSLAKPPSDYDKFVILFLHYQPEATTLPNGFEFSQQFGAVISLASALPQGYRLYVKEHPTIFTGLCTWKVRLPSLYKLIAQIPGVQLLPIESDPYQLIDKSVCVASVNGTVIGEALWRGKPVVAFSPALIRFANSPLLHKYSNTEDLSRFLLNIEELESVKFSYEDYFSVISGNTYSALSDEYEFDVKNIDHSKAFADAYIKACKNIVGYVSNPKR